VTQENADIEKENESIAAIQKKIRMAWPAPEPEAEKGSQQDNEEAKSETDEKPVDKKDEDILAAAFVKIQNYRDPPVVDATADNEATKEDNLDPAALAKRLQSETETIQDT
jgi:hypothetical protein